MWTQTCHVVHTYDSVHCTPISVHPYDTVRPSDVAHPCDVNIVRLYVQRHPYVRTRDVVLRGCDAAFTCRSTTTVCI